MKKPLKNIRHLIIARPKVRAWWPADAPMVITDATVFTKAPTPLRSLRTNTHNRAG